MPLYVVETIQTFRHRYIIECENAEHATDTVTMNEADEFSQMYLGENIISSKEITFNEFYKMNADLELYGDGVKCQPEVGSPWMGDKMIHKVEYPE